MSETTRRDLLRNAAIAAMMGPLAADAAQHVHNAAAEEKKATGAYKPKFFKPHEFRSVRRLSELIIPKDDVSPSAADVGATEFIDLLCSVNADLAAIYTGGLSWLDRHSESKHQKAFADLTADQQTAILDLIAFRKNNSPELGPGIVFFDWARKMVVDAFYTSPAGYKDVGFLGNKGASKFIVPEASIQHALKRSPV